MALKNKQKLNKKPKLFQINQIQKYIIGYQKTKKTKNTKMIFRPRSNDR